MASHPRVYRHPWSSLSAWSFLKSLVETPAVSLLTPTQRHAAILQQCLNELPEARGNLMHDLHTAAFMRDMG